MTFLENFHNKPVSYLDTLIKSKIHNHFKLKKLNSIEALKSEQSLLNQIQVLAALDYYTEKRMFKDSRNFIAKDERYNYGDVPFFNNNSQLFNVHRYIDNGSDGRLMNSMSPLLISN